MMMRRYFPTLFIAASGFLAALPAQVHAAPGSGANSLTGTVSVTNSACGVVNGNIFTDKSAVYVKPRSSNGGGAPLPNGTYYVKVTDPSGQSLLGGVSGPITVTAGAFAGSLAGGCLALQSIAPYSDTPNGGGEYKVWVSLSTAFEDYVTKTDNFKVRSAPPVAGTGAISVLKFYDAAVNGNASAQALLAGWQVGIDDMLQSTPAVFSDLGDPTYTVYENEPIGNSITNPYAWVPTNAYKDGAFAFTGPTPGSHFNALNVSLAAGEQATAYFGNVCIGPNAGAKTLGFWSNKNGQAILESGAYKPNWASWLTAMNLVDSNGSAFDPTNYASLRNWLLNGKATNMAYMLSVQLATLKLSVMTNLVSGSTNVYIPGLPDANAAGFISIDNLIAVADAMLGQTDGNITYAGAPLRTVEEALKNALDNLNNNRASVAQADGSRCPALNF